MDEEEVSTGLLHHVFLPFLRVDHRARVDCDAQGAQTCQQTKTYGGHRTHTKRTWFRWNERRTCADAPPAPTCSTSSSSSAGAGSLRPQGSMGGMRSRSNRGMRGRDGGRAYRFEWVGDIKHRHLVPDAAEGNSRGQAAHRGSDDDELDFDRARLGLTAEEEDGQRRVARQASSPAYHDAIVLDYVRKERGVEARGRCGASGGGARRRGPEDLRTKDEHYVYELRRSPPLLVMHSDAAIHARDVIDRGSTERADASGRQ